LDPTDDEEFSDNDNDNDDCMSPLRLAPLELAEVRVLEDEEEEEEEELSAASDAICSDVFPNLLSLLEKVTSALINSVSSKSGQSAGVTYNSV
jgi:hypothetical protein